MGFEMGALKAFLQAVCAYCSGVEPNSFKRLVQFSVVELKSLGSMKTKLKAACNRFTGRL